MDDDAISIESEIEVVEIEKAFAYSNEIIDLTQSPSPKKPCTIQRNNIDIVEYTIEETNFDYYSESYCIYDKAPVHTLNFSRSRSYKKPNDREMLDDITVLIEKRLIESPIGIAIKEMLEENSISYKTSNFKYPFIIKWERNNIFVHKHNDFREQVLIVMDHNQFGDMILENPKYKTISDIQNIYLNHIITICVLDIKSFTKNSSSKKGMVDDYVIDLQLNGIKRINFIEGKENYRDLSLYIMNLTKMISNLPHKDNKQGPFVNFGSTNRKSKKSNKDGKTAWIEMLMSIRPMSEEVATAIANEYPSAKYLYNVYFDPTIDENVKLSLLQEIKVKKLSRGWKTVGSEISKRVYIAMTTTDDKLILK